MSHVLLHVCTLDLASHLKGPLCCPVQESKGFISIIELRHVLSSIGETELQAILGAGYGMLCGHRVQDKCGMRCRTVTWIL